MEIKKIICKSGNEYNIVNESWETRNSWGHKSTLLASWGEVASRKVRYYNRTWECYRYQTCMNGLLNIILNDNLKSYITQFKEQHDITRLTAKLREQAETEWNNKEYIKDLKEIKAKIDEGKFD